MNEAFDVANQESVAGSAAVAGPRVPADVLDGVQVERVGDDSNADSRRASAHSSADVALARFDTTPLAVSIS